MNRLFSTLLDQIRNFLCVASFRYHYCKQELTSLKLGRIFSIFVLLIGTYPAVPVAAENVDFSRTLPVTVLRESSAAPEDKGVAAFFQVGLSQKNSSSSLKMQAATAKSSAGNLSNRRAHVLSKYLWHILDGAGIPMFLGQDRSYLDPAIEETYLIPSPMLPPERAVTRNLEQNATGPSQLPAELPKSANSDSPALLQKIPVSELEGVPLPAPR